MQRMPYHCTASHIQLFLHSWKCPLWSNQPGSVLWPKGSHDAGTCSTQQQQWCAALRHQYAPSGQGAHISMGIGCARVQHAHRIVESRRDEMDGEMEAHGVGLQRRRTQFARRNQHHNSSPCRGSVNIARTSVKIRCAWSGPVQRDTGGHWSQLRALNTPHRHEPSRPSVHALSYGPCWAAPERHAADLSSIDE